MKRIFTHTQSLTFKFRLQIEIFVASKLYEDDSYSFYPESLCMNVQKKKRELRKYKTKWQENY